MKQIFRKNHFKQTVRLLTLFLLLFTVLFLTDSSDDQQFNDLDSESGVHKVVFVFDGDTVRIDTGEKVRLIGIDAPESGNRFYEESKQYLFDKIYNQQVVLESDVSNRDKYGRLLRYIYFGEEFINEQIVKGGYARALAVPPDVRYADILFQAQQQAREQGRGLWKKQ